MKIAFVVNSYPPRLGGLEQHLENLAHGLAQDGHEVLVLTISEHTGVRSDGKVRVLTGRSNFPIAGVISFPRLGSRRRIARFLSDEHVDVVSTHTRFFPMSFVGLQAAHSVGVPVVHTEHGSGFVASPSPVISLGSRFVDLTLGRYVLSHADTVLAVSDEAAAFASRLGHVPASVFHNAITPATHAGPVRDRPQHLVFVGRLVPGKGWETFLDAVARLHQADSRVDAEILGTGADISRVRERVSELGLTGVVQVRGRVSPPKVREALAGATLLNPTVLSEGFQTTLLEALAERGRVVTYPVPGADLLRKQGQPVSVTSERKESELQSLLQASLRAPLPLAPEALIQQWTWPERVKEYETIIQETINNCGTNGMA
ncbi:glycosyltransferase family 4 protein [Actinomyces provencensis]|uniref:glycosyltransferase family 4 protein n=1 Tax=Actinomyces provencensis TaxID=1720198 RepID=UPI00096AAB86|nr:glycosyltransferase family 4 protein [Actinomyces provencensis]